MDFIIGLLLAIVLLLVLINFTSISVSDTNSSNQQQCGNNNLFSSLGFDFGNGSNINNIYQQSKIPQPVLAKAPSALNNKVNLEQQTYDYHKYFFVN